MRVSVVATGLEAAEGEQPSHLHILNQAQRIAPVRVPRPEEEPKAATPSIVTMRDEPVPAPEPAPEITDDMAESAADSYDSAPMDTVAEAEAEPVDSTPEAAEAAPAELQPRIPAALPGAGNVESFIPQRAVEVDDDDAIDGPAAGADPFEVAAMVNGSHAEDDAPRMGGLLRPKKEGRGLSLFERVTGTGRAKNPEQTAISEPAPAAQPAAVSDRGTIDALIRSRTATPQTAETPAMAPVQAPVQAAPIQPAPVKAPLGGVDPADRLPSAETEDDLLDIPAFLRRQAN